jgi:hypothetical protein
MIVVELYVVVSFEMYAAGNIVFNNLSEKFAPCITNCLVPLSWL